MCVKAIRMVHFVVMAEMLMRICLEVLMKNKTHKKTVKTKKMSDCFFIFGIYLLRNKGADRQIYVLDLTNLRFFNF